MSANEEVVAVLQRMEQNQLKSLEMQAQHLAMVRAQMEKTEARVQESISLQRVANSRQARALNVALPILLVALAYVGYMIFRHA